MTSSVPYKLCYLLTTINALFVVVLMIEENIILNDKLSEVP